VVQGIYTQGLTGTAPTFPEEMEQRITDYVAAAADTPDEWAAESVAPVFEPAVLPARLMPAFALAPVALAAPGPVFDPARSERRSKRDPHGSMRDR
jgi:hypothetical protein